MFKNKTTLPEPSDSLALVPRAFLELLAENQQKILERLEETQQPNLTGDFISEAEAKKVFGKGNTWFWNKQKSGELPFLKVGGKVWYHQADLLKLFEPKRN